MKEHYITDKETRLTVSNLGNVIGVKGKLLTCRINRYGYRRVAWFDNLGKQHEITVHRLVARNFIPNPLTLKFVNHKDENKLNNNASNLEWCTAGYNTNYGTRNKRVHEAWVKNGMTHPCVLEKDGKIVHATSICEMGKKIGVRISCVDRVVLGTNKSIHGWHLPGVDPIIQEKPIVLSDGERIISFKSQSEAARHFGVSSTAINNLVRGKAKSCKGFVIIDGK